MRHTPVPQLQKNEIKTALNWSCKIVYINYTSQTESIQVWIWQQLSQHVIYKLWQAKFCRWGICWNLALLMLLPADVATQMNFLSHFPDVLHFQKRKIGYKPIRSWAGFLRVFPTTLQNFPKRWQNCTTYVRWHMAQKELRKATSFYLCMKSTRQTKQGSQMEVLVLKIFSLILNKISMKYFILHVHISTACVSLVIWPFS